MDRPAEIDLLCRLCLVKDRVDIPIFEEQGDIRQIFLKISCCLPISISLEDSLPKKICDNCSIKLDSLYDFWNCTVNAEKTLLTWLGQAGVKDAGNTITAVAQQIAKPESQIVKVEDIPDLIDGGVVEDDEEEERPQKRARRSAAVKAQETIANVVGNEEDDEEPSAKKARSSVDEDDSDEDEASMKDNDDDDDDEGEDFEGIEPKMEDEGDESEGEVKPTFDAIPGTSAQDQPGPSGVGKIEADAPSIKTSADYGYEEIRIFLEQEPLYIKDDLLVVPNNDDVDVKIEENQHDRDRETDKHTITSEKNTNRKLQICHPEEPMIIKDVFDVSEINKAFECDFCDTLFNDQQALDIHIKKLHLGIEEEEPITNRDTAHEPLRALKELRIKNKQQLSMHTTRLHSGIYGKFKAFKCIICEYSFSRDHDLRKHINRLHSESSEKWKCNTCDESFKYKATLRLHIERSHLGINEKFDCQCGYCNKFFDDKISLNEHTKAEHSASDRFECYCCNKSFRRKSSLITHIRKFHSMVRNLAKSLYTRIP